MFMANCQFSSLANHLAHWWFQPPHPDLPPPGCVYPTKVPVVKGAFVPVCGGITFDVIITSSLDGVT